jgi:hypothetical protein
MIVTGVQSVGSKGFSAVQGAVADTKDAKTGTESERAEVAGKGTATLTKPGEPQPVVFPRSGLPMDQRPVALRQDQAAQRYREDGGSGDADHDGDSR